MKPDPTRVRLRHLAIIMDGNRRWASRRGQLSYLGHQEGVKVAYKIISHAVKQQLEVLSLYVFSLENWQRSTTEVHFLMNLFLKHLSSQFGDFLMQHQIRFYWIGFEDARLEATIINRLRQIECLTKNNQGLKLGFLFNYGGVEEIVFACNKLSNNQQLVTLSKLKNNLLSNELGDVDLLIRTSGEHRISNCLLFQISYAEIYFEDCLWPDFSEVKFDAAVEWYYSRQRRFGR